MNFYKYLEKRNPINEIYHLYDNKKNVTLGQSLGKRLKYLGSQDAFQLLLFIAKDTLPRTGTNYSLCSQAISIVEESTKNRSKENQEIDYPWQWTNQAVAADNYAEQISDERTENESSEWASSCIASFLWTYSGMIREINHLRDGEGLEFQDYKSDVEFSAENSILEAIHSGGNENKYEAELLKISSKRSLSRDNKHQIGDFSFQLLHSDKIDPKTFIQIFSDYVEEKKINTHELIRPIDPKNLNHGYELNLPRVMGFQIVGHNLAEILRKIPGNPHANAIIDYIKKIYPVEKI